MTGTPPHRRSRVPAGRIERLARLGWAAGELAAGELAGRARRWLTGGDAAGAAMGGGARARRLARRLAQLRGAAMKLGQLLSLESVDLLPAELSHALSVLRASADAMPATQLRRVLGREYGKGWEARFRSFEWEPVAAASIGQVHAAVARDGRRLALKIQYPGIARSIDADVDNVAALLRIADLLPVDVDVSGLVAEAKRQLHREADYRIEAASLHRYRDLVADEPSLFVPAAHEDLSTRRILAMDFVAGEPIESLGEPSVSRDRRDAAGEALERLVFRELFEFRFLQTDPNFANYCIDPETDRIGLLDFGSTREIEPALSENLPAPQAGRVVPALRADPRARRRPRADPVADRSRIEPPGSLPPGLYSGSPITTGSSRSTRGESSACSSCSMSNERHAERGLDSGGDSMRRATERPLGPRVTVRPAPRGRATSESQF